MVSIIIPVYNALSYAQECLESVYQAATGVPFEVIVVNNGSAPAVADWLAAERQRRPNLQVLSFDHPLGFAGAVNEGARAARFDFLMPLNSDAAITDGCLDALTLALQTDPKLGIVSPVTNHCGPGPQRIIEQPGPTQSLIYEPQRLFFFGVMIRRALWESLGGLDEVYQVGTYEDDDFCLRARLAGWSLGVVPGAFVRNQESRTFRENRIDRDVWMRRNREIFFDRASHLSRTHFPTGHLKPDVRSITVVVPVINGNAENLLDSLHSLINQTVTGFETILVASIGPTLPPIPDEVAETLRLKTIFASADVAPDALIEAGTSAARGDCFSYLPAGDIYYPFHLEVLHNALCDEGVDSVCTECRAGPSGWAEVVPLICWMHQRTDAGRMTGTRPLLRVTCEKGAASAKMDAERRRTGERARQLLLRSLAARTARLAAPRPNGLPAIFLYNIVRWDGLVQRPHHFAQGLAQRGYRVFWIDVSLVAPSTFLKTGGARKLSENLFHFQLPGLDGDIYHLPWNDAVLELMAAAMGQLRSVEGIDRAVQIVNFPGWTPLVDLLGYRFGWPIVYDCLDDQHAFADLFRQQTTSAYEGDLAGICDLLVTSGVTLYETKRRHYPKTVLIPNAADYPLFGSAVSQGLLDHLRRPVVGFFGAFADWLDVDWIQLAARRFPAYSFVYIGSEGFARPENLTRWRIATSAANIHLYPRADLPELAAYLAQFDVCIMPFQDLPVTRSMHAVKIYEYLAAGKHVMTPALPELRSFAAEGLLFTYDSYQRSLELLEGLVTLPPTKDQIAARQAFAARNTWSHRLDDLTQALGTLSPIHGLQLQA